MRRLALALLSTLVLAVPLQAGSPPDAHDLLGKVNQAYRGLDSYHFEGKIRVIATGGPSSQTVDVPFIVAADHGGRMRLDVRHPQMGVLMVSDGGETRTFLPALGQHTRKPAAAFVDSAGRFQPVPGSPIARYFGPLEGMQSAIVTGEQNVRVGERTADCWVLRCDVTPPGALAADSTASAVATFWVDKERFLVLHDSTAIRRRNPAGGGSMEIHQVTGFDHERINETVPDSIFLFLPPPEARQVETFTMPNAQEQESPLVGQKAPTFTLSDTKGRSVSLASQKGKVVVLDFWATWCGPCRIQMPIVEKLYQELKPRGLVVYGVNVAESPATVKSFLAKDPHTFPVLLDRNGDVAKLYQAEGIPTLVVIGKDGLIQSHFIGLRDENTLRAAILEANPTPAPAASRAKSSTAGKGAATAKTKR